MQEAWGAGPVPWAGLVDRKRPSSTFPCRPIRGREYKSWRCQGEGCEVARTRFGSSQVAAEALARAGAGAETRTCHHGHLHSPRTLRATRLSLILLYPTAQPAQVLLPAPPILPPCPVPRSSLEHKPSPVNSPRPSEAPCPCRVI